jgi:hypothetical protein
LATLAAKTECSKKKTQKADESKFPLRDSMQGSLSGGVVWCTAIIAIFAAMTLKLYQLTDLAM